MTIEEALRRWVARVEKLPERLVTDAHFVSASERGYGTEETGDWGSDVTVGFTFRGIPLECDYPDAAAVIDGLLEEMQR